VGLASRAPQSAAAADRRIDPKIPERGACDDRDACPDRLPQLTPATALRSRWGLFEKQH
jgi:hypothetical protein